MHSSYLLVLLAASLQARPQQQQQGQPPHQQANTNDICALGKEDFCENRYESQIGICQNNDECRRYLDSLFQRCMVIAKQCPEQTPAQAGTKTISFSDAQFCSLNLDWFTDLPNVPCQKQCCERLKDKQDERIKCNIQCVDDASKLSVQPVGGSKDPNAAHDATNDAATKDAATKAAALKDSKAKAVAPEKKRVGVIIGVILILSVLIIVLILIVFKRRKNAENSSAVPYKQITSSKPITKTIVDKKKYVAIHEYEPTLPDELMVAVDDEVDVLAVYDDGWCKALNVKTGKTGSCPFVCLKEKE